MPGKDRCKIADGGITLAPKQRVEPHGCPPPDSDHDGLRDPDDRCPATPETRNGFDVDGVEIKCRLDFGAKAIDWRGLYKNPGA